MFRNTFQSGFLSILYSIGSKPLQIWDATVQNGHVKRITDPDIQSSVVEIMGTNVSTNYIVCPADSKKTLGIKLPFLVMILKNMNKYFTFEVQVLDDKNVRRRFRASNYQSTTRVKPFICTMPMRLDEGWNQIQFNLSDFTRRAYGTNYIETLRVQIHANCRIRRIYFSDRLYTEDELPAEFRLLMPIAKKNRQLAAHAERDAVRKQAATETANNKASLCDRSGDGIRGGGGGGGESYRGLSDNDAIFGDSPDDDDDLYNGAGSFDQDGNYYGPAVQSREEEKKDEDDANHPLGPKTKLDSMFVSAGSQMPIGVDVAGVGFADSESLSSSRHIDLQARPQPKTKGRTGPRKKVARKSQKAGIENFRATSQLIVARPRPRRTRKLRISRRKIEDILACANNRRTENIMKMVEDVTAADIPAIVTSLIDPFQAGRGSENILLYLNCRDLAKASQISKNFQFWVQREISEKVLDYKRKTSLAWEVVKEEKWVHSADDCVKTKDFALTMKCASSIEGTDEKWGSIPTHMDVIEKLAGWCGGWLQFLYAREHGARPQPRSPTDRNKTILGVHVKKRGGGALPQAAVIFDIRRNGKWVWSGIRPISKEYLDRGTDKTDGLLRIYPFSEKTVGKSTDVEPPSHLGSTEARRASSFLISTAYDDQRTFTISASLVSEVSAETLIHDVSFIPRYLCRSLWNEREFHSLGTDHWDVGEGKYWNERLVACSEDGQHPTECNMYVADEERLVSYSHKNNAILERSHIYFHNCFWLDQEPSSTRDGSGEKPFIHMMTELVCERELITEMLLNIHV
mmetsp:Transcript_28691/g.83112  ORF Transcript_28691/g.83112 Transcript_28691/m.83112 type:complete len:802 (+) Transcript_28691:336-2741(+)